MARPKKRSPTASPSGFVALQMLHSPLAPPAADPEEGGPCGLCTARCCRYFALELDKPRVKADFDHIRWYLMHEGVAVWVSEGDWYLEVRTVCRHLRPDNACGIHETRPQICRDYGLPGGEPCEFFSDQLEYDLIFENDAEFDAWLADRDRRRKSRRKEKP